MDYIQTYNNCITAKLDAYKVMVGNKEVYVSKEYHFNTDALRYVNPKIVLDLGLMEHKVALYIINKIQRNTNTIKLNAASIARSLGLANGRSDVSKAISRLEDYGAIRNLAKCDIPNVECDSNLYVIHPRHLWCASGDIFYNACIISQNKIDNALQNNITIKVGELDIVDLDYWLSKKV